MTEQELIDKGWKPELCKIGTLYFKGNFFIRLDNDKALVFSNHDDMHPLGKAENYEGIIAIQKESDRKDILWLEANLSALKYTFEKKYGEKYDNK